VINEIRRSMRSGDQEIRRSGDQEIRRSMRSMRSMRSGDQEINVIRVIREDSMNDQGKAAARPPAGAGRGVEWGRMRPARFFFWAFG
jgi:hypothetical protein